MLQRIQSVYLLLSIALIVTSYFIPFGEVNHFPLGTYGVKNDGVYIEAVSSYYFHIPLFIVILLSGAAVFLYRNRARQLALVRLTFIMFAISFSLFAFYAIKAQEILDAPFTAGISLFLVFAAMILNWLALRAIRSDDKLVKSVDRIR